MADFIRKGDPYLAKQLRTRRRVALPFGYLGGALFYFTMFMLVVVSPLAAIIAGLVRLFG